MHGVTDTLHRQAFCSQIHGLCRLSKWSVAINPKQRGLVVFGSKPAVYRIDGFKDMRRPSGGKPSCTCRFGGNNRWDPSAGLPPSLCQGEAPVGELASWPRLLSGPLLFRLGSRLPLRLFPSLPAPARFEPSASVCEDGDAWTNPHFGSSARACSQCSLSCRPVPVQSAPPLLRYSDATDKATAVRLQCTN